MDYGDFLANTQGAETGIFEFMRHPAWSCFVKHTIHGFLHHSEILTNGHPIGKIHVSNHPKISLWAGWGARLTDGWVTISTRWKLLVNLYELEKMCNKIYIAEIKRDLDLPFRKLPNQFLFICVLSFSLMAIFTLISVPYIPLYELQLSIIMNCCSVISFWTQRKSKKPKGFKA